MQHVPLHVNLKKIVSLRTQNRQLNMLTGHWDIGSHVMSQTSDSGAVLRRRHPELKDVPVGSPFADSLPIEDELQLRRGRSTSANAGQAYQLTGHDCRGCQSPVVAG